MEINDEFGCYLSECDWIFVMAKVLRFTSKFKMETTISTVFLVIFMISCEGSAFSLFGSSSDDNQVGNSIESESDSGRFIHFFGMSADRGPVHDTPPSRCRCSCGQVNYESRIVGGKATSSNVFPWMVRLSYFGRFYCGGTLINDRYVLTAAHCVKGFMWFMIKVTFGEHDRCKETRPETRYVLRAISRPFNSVSYDEDIALLRLNDRVPINHVIRPICLPDRRANYAGDEAIVAGWGATEENGNTSCVLREVKVPIMSNLDCIQGTDYKTGMITENMMCAGYPDGEIDSCQGDSGGPLVIKREDNRFELAGIVSWGVGCARANFPGVYTRVTRYLNWIRQYTRDACYCQE